MQREDRKEKQHNPRNYQKVDWPSVSFDNRHPADVADHLETITPEEQLRLLRDSSLEDAANFVVEMEKHDRADLLSHIPNELIADIFSEMSPDDAADILDELDLDLRSEIFRHINRQDAALINDLLKFDPDTAGGVMNTEILVLDRNLTVDQAISLIRKGAEDIEVPYYAYVVDEFRHLKGVLSLRDLMLARSGTKLKELLKDQHLIYVSYNEDKEEVGKLIGRYDLLALPVVDLEQRLLGIVTVDDVIDIIQEEASEDLQTMVGAGSDETIDSPWLYSVRMRAPWLVINLFNSAVAAWVVHFFEGSIAQMSILAVLMPLVANQAGNTGQQSLAVMIRQLALERFDRKKVWKAVLREARIGLLNGLGISILLSTSIMLWTGNLPLSLVVGIALGGDMLLGSIAGASIPLILKELGRDPAQASSIFLTTLTDSAGFLALLGLATLVFL
ncbi:MAG: magnesium transporter [Thermodesulfobacteriota bacterium]